MIQSEAFVVERSVTLASHSHSTAQLTLALHGAFQIEGTHRTWTVPANRAAWIPAGVEHAERLPVGASLRTLRIDASLTGELPAHSRTIDVSPLLRELIVRVAESGSVPEGPERMRLVHVLLDEVRAAPDADLELAAPRDPRALRVARSLQDAPGERSSIADLARRTGLKRRTLERLFVADLGMSIGEWRQRLRLHHALGLLAEERPIGEVAREAGYGSAPAFIAVFKRHFGVTPHQYRRPAPDGGPNRRHRAR